MKKIVLLFSFFLLANFFLNAQNCFPGAEPNEPVPGCACTVIDCDLGFNGISGTLGPSTGTNFYPGCPASVINNDDWYAFVAETPNISFTVIPSNCEVLGGGLTGMQGGIYATCSSSGDPLEEGSPSEPVALQCDCTSNLFELNANDLHVGRTYYLVVDGCAGVICDYEIILTAGSALAPIIPEDIGAVQGASNVCQGNVETYEIPDVYGAATYDWSVFNATIIHNQGNSIDVFFNENGPVEICVTLSNDCYTSTPSCLTVSNAPVMDTIILDETLCFGECLEINDTEFCESGYWEVAVDNGCDSTYYEIDLTILDPIQTDLQEILCEFECYQLGGNEYCESGIYTVVLVSYMGCDSTVVLDLTVLDDSTPDITVGNTGPLDCANTSVFLLASSTAPNASYFWEGPGINANNQNLQSPEVFEGGMYTVTVTTVQGCTNSAGTEVLGDPAPPEIDITGNDPLNCNNLENTIIASSSTHQNIDFEWIDGGVVVSTGPEITVNETGELTLAIATPSGCLDTITVEVTENNDPLFVDGGPNRHIQCEFIMQLNAPGAAGSNVAYEWTTNDGNILSGANTLVPVINTAGTYTLTATDLDNGCTGSADVIVYNALTVISEDVLTMDCTVSELTIDASESYDGQDAFIQWSTPNGNIVEGENSLTPVVDAPGSYQLVIIRPGCVSFATAVVIDNTQEPGVTIQNDGTVLTCLDGDIELTAVTNASNATFYWTRNGFPFSVEQQVTVFAGAYYEVVVTGENGCTSAANITIEEDLEPYGVTIIGDTELDCTSNGIGTLFAITGGANSSNYSYLWFTDDGEILGPNFSDNITFNGPGTYSVTVDNPFNLCSYTAEVEVVVTSVLDATVEVTDVSCPNSNDGAIEVVGIGGGTPPFTYLWSSGQANTSLITDLSPGQYGVTVIDANGCFDAEIVEVGVSSNSTIIADAGDDELFDCQTTFLVLDGSNSEYPQDATIEWTTQDGEILANGDTPFPTVGAPGTYVINISDPFGCFDSDEVAVFEVTADAGPDRFINCSFPSVNLNGTGSQGGSTYLWTTLDGNITEGETTLTPTVNATGTYTLAVTSANGCTAESSVMVTGDFAEPQLTANDQFLDSCIDPVILSAEADIPGTVFAWNGPAGPLMGENPEVFDPGVYTVLGTAPNGCTNITTMEVIDGREFPDVIGNPVQYLNCFNGIPYTIELEFISPNGVEVQWTTNDGNILSQNGLNVVIDAAGSYDFYVFDLVTECSNAGTVFIEEDGLDISTSQTTTSCGENDGTAAVTTEGINHPVFEWSNGAATSSVDGLAPGIYTVTISSATGSCTEERIFEILQDPSCLVVVSGTIYDDDTSLACDPEGDVSGMEDVLVHILPVDEYTTTDENGYYEFLVPAGQYTIEALPVSPWVVSCPVSETIDLDLPPGIAEAPENDFFLDKLSGFDLYGYGISGSANPGGTQFYQLTYCNNAFTTIHGTVEFTHDPLLTGFDVEASGASSYDPLTYTAVWDFDDLSFFECEYISFSLNVPVDIPDGYVLNSSLLVNPTDGDISPANNSYSWAKVVSNPGNTSANEASSQLVVAEQGDGNVLMQNRPNPFAGTTLIPFYIRTTETVELLVFDANGRLMKQYRGFEKGYNQVEVRSEELNGNGLYYYRLVTEETSLTGKMILME